MSLAKLFESAFFGRKCLLEQNQPELLPYFGARCRPGDVLLQLWMCTANATQTKRKSESIGMSCPSVPCDLLDGKGCVTGS